MTRKVVEFEGELVAALGGIDLYRAGVDDFYLSYGLPRFFEKLESARKDLEQLGMYEMCRDALARAYSLFQAGPEYDETGTGLILEATRVLMRASGSYQAMERRWNAANDASDL